MPSSVVIPHAEYYSTQRMNGKRIESMLSFSVRNQTNHWHRACDYTSPAGFGSESQIPAKAKAFVPPIRPSRTEGTGIADRESRLNPVPSSLLWALFFQLVTFGPANAFCVHSARERMIRLASA